MNVHAHTRTAHIYTPRHTSGRIFNNHGAGGDLQRSCEQVHEACEGAKAQRQFTMPCFQANALSANALSVITNTCVYISGIQDSLLLSAGMVVCVMFVTQSDSKEACHTSLTTL
jgi:hypothetical protein